MSNFKQESNSNGALENTEGDVYSNEQSKLQNGEKTNKSSSGISEVKINGSPTFQQTSDEKRTGYSNFKCSDELKVTANTDLTGVDFPLSSTYTITRYIIEKGRKSMEVKSLFAWICCETKTLSEDIADVWAGYEKSERKTPILVAELKRKNEKLPHNFRGFELYYRLHNYVSNEAASCIDKDMKGTSGEKETRTLQDCLTAQSPSLFKKHKNLLIMSASKVKCKNYAECKIPEYKEQTCIVLYVKIKGIIPFDEDPFPKEIGGFPVDVREAYFDLYANADLAMGSTIENDYGKVGSLGGFVKLPNGTTGALTCWHLFETEGSKHDLLKDWPQHRNFKRNIYHSLSDIKYKFGRVVQWNRTDGDEYSVGTDAALLEITDPAKLPKNGHFPTTNTDTGSQLFSLDSGDIVTSFTEIPVDPSFQVVKYGATTKLTFGQIAFEGVAVRKWRPEMDPIDRELRLHQQIEVFPKRFDNDFAKMGDSGSLVLLVSETDGSRALGLLVGGTSYRSVIVTPIWSILNSFDLPLSLMPFEKSRFETIEKGMRQMQSSIDALISRTDAGIHEITQRLPKQSTS